MRYVGKATIIAVALAAIVGGNLFVSDDKSESLVTRNSQDAVLQVMGSGRWLVQLSLWHDLERAKEEGAWQRAKSVFRQMQVLAPNNVQLVRVQAEWESVGIAPSIDEREIAWQWHEGACDLLTDAIARVPDRQSEALQSLWLINFRHGHRFPLATTKKLANFLKRPELLEFASILEDDWKEAFELHEFLERYDHLESLPAHFSVEPKIDSELDEPLGEALKAFAKVPDQQRELLVAAELLRANALESVAWRGQKREHRTSTDCAHYYLLTQAMQLRLATDQADLFMDNALKMVRSEVTRLKELGDPDAAEQFESFAMTNLRRWKMAE